MNDYLAAILDSIPVNTEFKVCAEFTELDKAWQRCERFGSHAIKIHGGSVQGEWLVRIIPYHVVDEEEYSGNVVQGLVSAIGICTVFYVFIGWLFS